MGLFSSVGKAINSITGASSSAKKTQKYNIQLAKLNQQQSLEAMAKQFEYEKEAAQNAHQWEIADLEKAGINPILTYGGQGASADAGLTSGSAPGAGSISAQNTSMFDIINAVTSAKKSLEEIGVLGAQTENIEADTAGKLLNNKWITPKAKQEIGESMSRVGLNSAKAVESKANTKYQNERARGYSESTSTTKTWSGEGKIFGSGGSASRGKTKTKSRTY